MEIQYFGANCIKVSSKKTTVVIDDNLKEMGGSSIAKQGDIQLFTSRLKEPVQSEVLVVDRPGEYEVADVSIVGVGTRAHIDEEKTLNATMYKIEADDIKLAVVGHVHPDLTEQQLEELGTIDILVVPVGGSGFTLDPVGALKVIKEIDPKIIIPTYYADSKLKYPVPAVSLEEALKGLSMEPKETITKFKVKGSELLTDQPQLIILERQ